MAQCERIGEGVATAPPPPERRNSLVKSIDFDHESAQAELIGSASSAEAGRPRWTELKVWYLHNPPQKGRRWLSEVYGMSSVAGETPRIQRLNVGSLERALKLFGDWGDLGVVASEEARDWEESKSLAKLADIERIALPLDPKTWAIEHPILQPGDPVPPVNVERLFPPIVAGELPESDPAALEWLYGETDGGKATFASMLAKDFDLAPRTVTTALAQGTDIRVPLRAVLPWFDRMAFRAARKDTSDV